MSAKKKNTKGAYASLTGAKRAIPIILFALALFIAVCFIAPGNVGLGKYIGGFLLGLFSVGGYLVPFFLALHAFFYPSDVQKKRVAGRIVFTLIVLLCFSALFHSIKYLGDKTITFSPGQFYRDGQECSGGGFFGGILGFLLIKLFGPIGMIIFAALIFALYVTYFFASGKSALAKLLLKILDKISDVASRHEKKKQSKKEEKQKKTTDAKHPRLSPKHEELYDDEFFSVDNGMSEFKIDELGIKETRKIRDAEKFPHLEDKVTHNSAILCDDDVFETNHEENSAKKDDISSEFKGPKQETQKNTPPYYSESADEIFAKDFDPFDFDMNAKRSAKQAEKTREAANVMNEFAEPVRTFTEDELREARRRDDFERKKKALLEAEERRRAIEEETKRQEKLKEILKEEPTQPKAVYTQYNAATFFEKEKTEEASPVYDLKEQIKDTQTSSPSFFEEARSADGKLFDGGQASDNTDTFKIEDQGKHIYSNGNDFAKDSDMASSADCETETVISKEPEFKEYRIPSFENVIKDEPPEDVLKLSREPLEAYADDDISEDAIDKELTLDESEDENDGFELGFGDDEDDVEMYEEPIPEELQNPDVSAYRGMFNIFSEDKQKSEAVVVTNEEPLKQETELYLEDDEPPFELEKPQKSADREEKKPSAKLPDYSNYQAPPLELLKKGNPEVDEDINEEIENNGEKLIDTLAQFNVRASIRSVDVGPRITRYEIVPAKGVRVNSVINLFDDIALNLAAEGIRMEAPIPGKSAIGVEIPNKHPQMVFLRDLLETDEFKNASSTTMACFGKDVTGNPVLGDIAKMPHMLIAGATGMGKSVCINAIMLSMLFRSRPDELKFIMIDPKMVEFNGYNGIPHLLIPVIIDVKQAAGALMWAVEQMEKRYEMFLEYSVKNLDGYNQKMRENPERGKPLPKIVIVIDELNDLMLQARKPVEDLIMRIAQKARAAGIHLIIGTQRPSVDVITGVIKANIPSRIACKVSSFQDSKTILEQAGAEKLLNNGDMLFWPVGKPKPTRVQGAFVSDSEVEKIMNYLKSQNKGDNYDEQALAEINSAAQKCVKGGKGDDAFDDDDGEADTGYFNDPQFMRALELAVSQGKIATSLIQRKLGIGYGKAAKFIDIMQDQGFVSEPNGQKAREVLITKDELHEILSRRSLD